MARLTLQEQALRAKQTHREFMANSLRSAFAARFGQEPDNIRRDVAGRYTVLADGLEFCAEMIRDAETGNRWVFNVWLRARWHPVNDLGTLGEVLYPWDESTDFEASASSTSTN